MYVNGDSNAITVKSVDDRRRLRPALGAMIVRMLQRVVDSRQGLAEIVDCELSVSADSSPSNSRRPQF
jgi:hypothetical protein